MSRAQVITGRQGTESVAAFVTVPHAPETTTEITFVPGATLVRVKLGPCSPDNGEPSRCHEYRNGPVPLLVMEKVAIVPGQVTTSASGVESTGSLRVSHNVTRSPRAAPSRPA